MKLFDQLQIPAKQQPYLIIQKQAIQMIIEICKTLQISLPAMHAALWIFHCNSLIMGFHNFDRYLYACGAVLVGSKLMQCIRYPIQIFRVCRKILRKRKNIQYDQDTDQYLKRQVKRVFQAQVNILINIGFDFDIKLAIQQAQKLKLLQLSPVDSFITKYRQTLVTLYSTQVVVLYEAEVIAFLALRIILRAENKSINVMEFQESVKERLQSQQIKNAEKQFLQRCIFI